jgi:hypothetical protein
MDEHVTISEADLEASANAFNDLPLSSTCRLITFDKAHAQPGIVNGTWFLYVSGEKLWSNMLVELIPAIYVTTPDYWLVEVVGCVSGIGLPIMTPYHVTSTQLTRGNGIGNKGIEILGATHKQIIDI